MSKFKTVLPGCLTVTYFESKGFRKKIMKIKKDLKSNVLNLVEMTRPKFILVYFCVFAVAFLITTHEHAWNSRAFIVGTVVGILLKSFASYVNDINDVEIDKIIHPERALPQEKIEIKKVKRVAGFYAFLSCVISFANGPMFVLLSSSVLFLIYINFRFIKKTKVVFPVTFVTNVCVAATVLLGWGSAGFMNFENIIILFLAVLFGDIAHDAASSIADVKGDKIFGIKTYAVIYGPSLTAKIVILSLTISSFFYFFIITRFPDSQLWFLVAIILIVWDVKVVIYNALPFLSNYSERKGMELHNEISNYVIVNCILICIQIIISG